MDDYYLSKQDRAARGLPWRGPPGSHDVGALVEVLDRIRVGHVPIMVQRFSPEIDDRIDPVTIAPVPTHVIVEGWVLGHRRDGYAEILDRSTCSSSSMYPSQRHEPVGSHGKQASAKQAVGSQSRTCSASGTRSWRPASIAGSVTRSKRQTS